MGGIVVGANDSETACRALKRAAFLAEALGEPLHLVMAVKPGTSGKVENSAEQFVIDWISEARQRLHRIRSEAGLIHATTSIGAKDPAKAICAEAEDRDASLIVVGNRRMQGASRVLGAVAADVLRNANCDVVVTYTKTEDRELDVPESPENEPRPAIVDADIARIRYSGRPLWL